MTLLVTAADLTLHGWRCSGGGFHLATLAIHNAPRTVCDLPELVSWALSNTVHLVNTVLSTPTALLSKAVAAFNAACDWVGLRGVPIMSAAFEAVHIRASPQALARPDAPVSVPHFPIELPHTDDVTHLLVLAPGLTHALGAPRHSVGDLFKRAPSARSSAVHRGAVALTVHHAIGRVSAFCEGEPWAPRLAVGLPRALHAVAVNDAPAVIANCDE